jgi:hypothetical protein
MKASKPKKILITFARSFLALHWARLLKAAGHEVYTADSMNFHASYFSNAVTKNFHVPSPRHHLQAYMKALVEIVTTENIELLIPIYEEISFLSRAYDYFPATCELFFPTFEVYNTLNNKWMFQCKLQELGFETLQNALIFSKQDLDTFSFDKPFALKACYSRASQQIVKMQPDDSLTHLKFDPHNPWLAQEWLEGERYCTYSLCYHGAVHAHATYPVQYAIDGHSCLTFEAVEHAGIFNWVSQLVKQLGYTGQIAFDFIISKDNRIFAIECNPRATSGILLFNQSDHLERAFAETSLSLIQPKLNARVQIALGMMLFGWRKSALPNNRLARFIWDFCRTKDVVFNIKDLKPFIFEPLIVAFIIKESRKYGISIPNAFIYDHEWNGEPVNLAQPTF